MQFESIQLTNWKNFRTVSVTLPERGFLIGPNASGKSNFLDAFRFLRTIAATGGSLQLACQERGGVSKIRALLARNPPDISIKVTLRDGADHWVYEISFNQEGRKPRQGLALIKREVVTYNGKVLLDRPNEDDKRDSARLTETALEQTAANQSFRKMAEYFASTVYLHVVPQMIRNSPGLISDIRFPSMYGGELLESIAKTPKTRREARLKKIEAILREAIPQFKELTLRRDELGKPHLEVVYQHWRPKAGRQDENQFSDGTLRLIGLLWALQEGNSLVLLEEPELSLHRGIVVNLASFIYRAQQRKSDQARQVLMSTHSVDLLSDSGIEPREIIVFTPSDDQGTVVKTGLEIESIRTLMNVGIPASEAALPHTESDGYAQLHLFEL